jgi:ribosome-associated heat shock protein Hsp15
MSDVRLDKWLWAARFYKTRSLAQEQLDKGRVKVKAGEEWLTAKPGRDVHVNDMLMLNLHQTTREIKVLALNAQRGSATVAQGMYEETAESIAKREKQAALNKLAPMPGTDAGWHDGKGRPTKRDRRELDTIKLKLKHGSKPFDW